MTTPRHLVAIWNPSYAADAMDEHLSVLLHWSERANRGEVDPREEVYVWWARLRSPNRTGPLPHLPEVIALKEQLDRDVETHLYLTDYRSLYVGWLGDIESEESLKEWEDEYDHLPKYSHGKPADLYFQLWDIRRLIADDTVGVSEELARMRNVRYDLRPVSLYGGMVDLPLIVERPDARMWFGDDGSLTDGRLWAEHDAQLRSETDRIGHDLRENLFGDDVWKTFEPGTRAFLASGEASFRGRRHDPAFDFSAPAIAYAKAVETEINTLLFSRLRRFYGKGNPIGRHTTVDGKPLDLGDTVSHQTLGTIINLLQHNEDVKRGIRGAFVQTDVQWLLGELPHYLEPIARLRNPAAHSQRLSQDDAAKLREQTLGIGQEGLLVRIARAKLRQLTA